MNQKKCEKCNKLIYITAPTCLFCGRPNKFVTKDYINRKWNKDNSNYIKLYSFLTFRNLFIIFIFILVIIIIIFH